MYLLMCFQLGANSGLHIIIFDELDAICKQRGTGASSTGVHDTVVNQLLSKIDGVEQLNNILVIGKSQSLQFKHNEPHGRTMFFFSCGHAATFKVSRVLGSVSCLGKL